MYIGAVAVLPTYVLLCRPSIHARAPMFSDAYTPDRLLEDSKSGKQALREVIGHPSDYCLSRVSYSRFARPVC